MVRLGDALLGNWIDAYKKCNLDPAEILSNFGTLLKDYLFE
jgi:hypothetical protein